MTDLEYLFGLEYFGLKLGLDNIATLLHRLGHPERAFTSIHVAGTNGKGSVTAMVDAMLRAGGRRAARYTSPHLVSIEERFVIDGLQVSRADLNGALTSVRRAAEDARADGALDASPTFFEATTAMAFLLFQRAGVEFGVIEVGLGGRLDATNVVAPAVTAITSVALDHQEHLGGTLGAIAREKAGIIKPGVPVVVGPLPPEARGEIVRAAQEQSAPLVDAAAEVDAAPLGPAEGDAAAQAQRIRLRTPVRDYGEVTLSLAGDHQIHNAAVAVRTVELLGALGVALSEEEAVVSGLGRTSWPGRIDRRRLPDGRVVILDAAHNPSGAAALAAFLQRQPGAVKPPIVFGAMRDKDARGMLKALAPAAGALVLTRPSNRRAADPESLANLARAIAPTLVVLVAPDPVEALATASRMAPVIVVAGSVFLLGDVIPRLP